MDEVNRESQHASESPRDHKEYVAPSLIVLGRMQDLTASGTGGMMEHGHGASAIYSLA